MFGKPATVALRLLTMPSAQTSARLRPSRPRIFSAIGRSVTWKPVASTIVSVGRSTPSRRDDRVRPDLGDAGGDQLGVGRRHGREVVVADQDPLAADRVVRRQRRAQLRVADLALQVGPREPADRPEEAAPLGQADHEELAEAGRGPPGSAFWKPGTRR